MSPGLSPGKLSVVGNFSMDTGGTLLIELGGTDNSDPMNPQYDVLAITGEAILDGTLQISLIEPFVPDHGDSFQVLTSGTLMGRFEDITGAFLDSAKTLAPVYDETDLTLVAALPGDNTLDGSVDTADLALVRNVFGSEGDWTDGDSTLDGQIDAADLAIVRNRFGSSVPSASTPEPTALGILSLSCLVLLRRP